MTDGQLEHEPQSTNRHHSDAQDASVVTGGAHGGAHVQQPTVGEDASENPAEGWDPAEADGEERDSAH